MGGAPRPQGEYELPLSRHLPGLLAWITLALVAVHLLLQVLYHRIGFEPPYELRSAFDVDQEASVPTWFNAIELFVVSLMLLAIARETRRRAGRYVRHWFGLAIGFCVMSIDEIAGFHEGFNTDSSIVWTIPAAILVVILGVVYLKFVLHLPVRSRWLFVASGAVYLGGVLGVEALTTSPVGSLPYAFMTALEEGMEMSGLALFVYALLDYMTALHGAAPPGVALGTATSPAAAGAPPPADRPPAASPVPPATAAR